jgi:Predicted periplasmic protein
MYQSDRSPVGLYVENGRELVRANTAAGRGNFYIKPNGIFYVSGENASILETRRFLQQRPHSDIATQSGPMLVINGGINAKFLPISNSRKIRNGVGVQDGHRVVFVISNDPVTFGKFAQFFRDALHCSNALYLDGSISSIYAPSVQRADYLWPLGPIIGVYARSN